MRLVRKDAELVEDVEGVDSLGYMPRSWPETGSDKLFRLGFAFTTAVAYEAAAELDL